MANTRIVQISPPSRGVDEDASPWSIAKDRAPALENLLPDRAGKLRMRGAVQPAVDGDVAVVLRGLAGLIPSPGPNNLLLGAQRATDAVRTSEPWVQRHRQTGAATLAQGTALPFLYYDLLSGLGSSYGPATRATTFGPMYDQWNNVIYAPAYDTATDAGNDLKVRGAGSFRMTQVLTVFPDATGSIGLGVNAPRGAIDLKFFAGRMMLAGGSKWDGAANGTLFTNHLWYSNPMATFTGAAITEWTDPVTGANNTLLVGDDSDGDAIVAMAHVGRALLVFKRYSTYVLTGSGPSSFSVRRLFANLGLLDPRAVCEISDTVFFLSQQGFYLWDGASLSNVTEGVANTLFTSALAAVGGSFATPGAVVSAARLDAENVLVLVAQENFSPVTASLTDAAIFNIRTKTWTKFSTPYFAASGGPTRAVASVQYSYAHGLKSLTAAPFAQAARVEQIASPDRVPTASRGYDVSSSIPMEYRTPVQELASPPFKAALRRFMMEYTFRVAGDTSGSASGWYVTITDANGTVLVPEFAVPIEQPGGDGLYTKRYQGDVFGEANAVQVKIRYDGASRNITNAEIVGVWLEYAPAQETHA